MNLFILISILSISSIQYINNQKIAFGLLGFTKLIDKKSIDILNGLEGKTVWSLELLSDEILASGQEGEAQSTGPVFIWNITDGRLLANLKHGSGKISPILSINQTMFATGSTDKSIHVWSLPDFNISRIIDQAHNGEITDMKMSRNKLFMLSSDNSELKKWNIENFTETKRVNTNNFCSKINAFEVLFNDSIVCACENEIVVIYDSLLNFLSQINVGYKVLCIKLLSNEKLVIGGEDEYISIIDLSSRSKIDKTFKHSGIVLYLELISNRFLISSSLDKTVKIWDLFENEEKNNFEFACPIYSIKYIPNSIIDQKNETNDKNLFGNLETEFVHNKENSRQNFHLNYKINKNNDIPNQFRQYLLKTLNINCIISCLRECSINLNCKIVVSKIYEKKCDLYQLDFQKYSLNSILSNDTNTYQKII